MLETKSRERFHEAMREPVRLVGDFRKLDFMIEAKKGNQQDSPEYAGGRPEGEAK